MSRYTVLACSPLFLGLWLFCHAFTAHAVLDINITEGRASALPVAVGKFRLNTNGLELPENPGSIILADLLRSGYFAPSRQHPDSQAPEDIDLAFWRKEGSNYLVLGDVSALDAQNYLIRYWLINVFGEPTQMLGAEATVPRTKLRRYAHQISDKIFETITGRKSSFTSSIAYVLFNKNQEKPYRLIIADYDGHNELEIIKAKKTLMSPDISPDQRKVAYVSFENDKSEVFVQDLYSGKRTMVAGEKGINSSPAFSPDGSKLAVVMSPDNNVDIYVIDLESGQRQRITRHSALDTEPSWFDEGRQLIFTSNRGGSPQLYRYDLTKKQSTRVTYDGSYNTSGMFNQQNTHLVMVHRVNGRYQIALKNMSEQGYLNVMTRSSQNITPSFSPDGHMILYATKNPSGQSVLAVMSVDGEYKITLPSSEGEVRDPVWSY